MNIRHKSRLASLALTILFGPLGLFYSAPLAAVILLVMALLTLGTLIGPVICWVLAIAWGDHATHRHNQGRAEFIKAVRG